MARNSRRSKQPDRRELKIQDLEAIVERARAALSEDDHQTLKAAVDTLAFVTRELETKGTSIRRLRKLLFGASTERTRDVLGESDRSGPDAGGGGSTGDSAAERGGNASKPKPKGHGRNPASAYRGADKVPVPHGELARGDRCPDCKGGKLYRLSEPKTLVRVTGMAPLRATVYELERLRCNLCGTIHTAKPPPGVGAAKYDETAASMIGLLKYGCGVPFHRLEKLQRDLGIPLPAATQWEVVERAATRLAPAFDELVRQAAQGEVVHNDDTRMKILELPASVSEDGADERTGVFTSGIVATGDGHEIAVFFTGRQHAGENLADVLARRAAELPPPIQMCDALSHNTAGDFETILAGCNAHARRRFVDVVESFPDECRFVLETLRDVFRIDAEARQHGLSADDRLRLHQDRSAPLMQMLEDWLREQIETRKVEPNSGLGDAITYMRKHWSELTLFLREPGAPLDNNICERALKKAILHRKNALFYKTENGARVGDLFMSLIHTAELCDADPFEYLVALQTHPRQVAEDPGAWMPWNYGACAAESRD